MKSAASRPASGKRAVNSVAWAWAIGNGDAFAKGRDFAAWLGLVPKQISTRDRTILGKISKRGNRYLRVLFVQTAWVVLIKPKSWERHGLKPWLQAAKKRLQLVGGTVSACFGRADSSFADHPSVLRAHSYRGFESSAVELV